MPLKVVHSKLLVHNRLSAYAHMAEIYRPRSKVCRAAVLTSHRLAHPVNGAQVEHEIPSLLEDLTAKLALHLVTKAVTTFQCSKDTSLRRRNDTFVT